MKYSGSVAIRSSASRWRLRALVRELQSMACQVRLDVRRGCLELDVPDDLYCWIRVGSLGRLLQSYGDVVWDFPHFYEVADEHEGLWQLLPPEHREGLLGHDESLMLRA